jgi:ethanolamine utilization microcompartment shell protein EutL
MHQILSLKATSRYIKILWRDTKDTENKAYETIIKQTKNGVVSNTSQTIYGAHGQGKNTAHVHFAPGPDNS